jgi:hypothetical protein
VDRVTIVGHAPYWVNRDRVEYVPGNKAKHRKQENVYNNILAAVTHPGHADEVVLMNDDFFILQPVTGPVQMAYRCDLARHVAKVPPGWWHDSLAITEKWLRSQGCPEPLLSYELHRPFPVKARDMAAVLLYARQVQPRNPPQWRTLYGNYFQVPAIRVDDAKISGYAHDRPLPDVPFLSTEDSAWIKARFAAELRDRYPYPSPYERNHV